MKKTIILFGFLIVGFAMLFPLYAQGINLGQTNLQEAAKTAGFDENTDQTTLSSNIGLMVRIVLSMSGVIFGILTVYAGILWMTARGSEEQTAKAQKIIFACVIGLIITLAAYSITAFVVPRILQATADTGTSQP
jgi:hypothetical protein